MAWAPDYVTPEEFRAWRRGGTPADDPELARMIGAAARAIDDHCGRQFGNTDSSESRTFELRWARRRRLWATEEMDDIHDATGIVVTVSGSPTTSYELTGPGGDLNVIAKGRPYTTLYVVGGTRNSLGGGPPRVTIETDKWGWSAVPDGVAEANMEQVNRFLNRVDSPYGIAGSPDVGSEMRLLAKLDPDVVTMLEPFRLRRRELIA